MKKITEENYDIEVGDMIYRKEKAHYEKENGKKKSITDIPGHVEFYIGNGKYVGWGKIQKDLYGKKEFIKNENGFFSNSANDYGQPYISIISIKGER